jgi:hypothetical protein
LGEEVDGRLGGGNIDQLAVDAQTVADLCDAAPDDEVRIEFLSQGVGIGQRKLPARGFLKGGKDRVFADDIDLLVDGDPGSEHISDSLADIVDIFRAVDGKGQNGDGVSILCPQRLNRNDQKQKACDPPV